MVLRACFFPPIPFLFSLPTLCAFSLVALVKWDQSEPSLVYRQGKQVRGFASLTSQGWQTSREGSPLPSPTSHTSF